MKILVISNMYPSEKDPVYGTFVKVFFDGLINNNHTASLIAIKGKGLNALDKLWKYLNFYFSVFISLILNKYDVVYVHTISHTSPPILLASKIKKLNLIFNIHGDDLLTTSKLAHRLRNLAIPLLKKSKMIVVPTEYFKKILLDEFYWLKPDKIIISPSGGLNKQFFIDKNHEKQNIVPILGYVSRIDEGKGWDVLLDALKEVSDKGYHFKLFMVGSGKQEIELKEKITDLGFSDTVEYLGPLTHSELPKFYSSLDWFIFPSYREGESLGLVGLEAMAAHTPVIGSNMAGLQSYIIDKFNGYFFEPKNVHNLAQCIIKAINLPHSEKAAMSYNAFTTALKYESSQVNCKLFTEIENKI